MLQYINKQLYRRYGKRLFDLLLASICALLLLPISLIIALVIYLNSGKPILYRRRVVGTDGNEFDAFKFRTMVRNAEQIIEENLDLHRRFKEKHKLKNDFRVTPIGQFLRKFSLDEIPQLINVLKGQMSLVGPRMICVDELEKYGFHKDKLLSVKPAMTGYWQVNGRQKTSYDERVKMDMYYIERFSLVMDIKILLQTPSAVSRADGAH